VFIVPSILDVAFLAVNLRINSSGSPSGAVKGEITPFYSCLTVEGIKHVKRLAGGVKLIYLIRDPMARALSSLRMNIERAPLRSQIELVCENYFQKRGDYRKNISSWESIFDREKILYLPFGWISHKPEDLMRDVEAFLNLPRFDGYEDLSGAVNPTKEVVVGNRATEILVEQTRDQYDFLQDRFGVEFVSQLG
jgi:hypothetical protein